MKLERRNEGTTDRDQDTRHDQSLARQQRGSRAPSSELEMRLDGRDDDDQFRGKSDGEMLARYEF